VPDAGAALVARIEAELAAVEARLREAPRPRTLMLVGRSPFVAAGDSTYQGELIERAHGANLVAGNAQAWPHLSLEFIVAQAPEVIIDASMGSESASDRAAALAVWQDFPTVPAVRDRRIYGHGVSELLRPGPRVAETLATVARFIHPERFEDAEKDSPQMNTDKHR
jgi:ABC-type Fe3+-hydroxamate transport system substrate-binding protein